MKKTLLLISFGVLLPLLACHREETLQKSTAVTEQFLRGESSEGSSRVYYMPKGVGVAHTFTLFRDFTPIFEKFSRPEQWPSAQSEFSAKYEAVWGMEERRTNIDVLLDLEFFTYEFLNQYLLRVTPDEAVKQAAAYHLRHLFELQQPAQWDVLTRALLLSRGQLPPAEWEEYKQYIVSNARRTLEDEQQTTHLRPETRANQLRTARFALDALTPLN